MAIKSGQYIHYWFKNASISGVDYSDLDSIYEKHISDFRSKAKKSFHTTSDKKLDKMLDDFASVVSESSNGSKNIFAAAFDKGCGSVPEDTAQFFKNLSTNVIEFRGRLSKIEKTANSVQKFCNALEGLSQELFSSGTGSLYTSAISKVVADNAGKEYSELTPEQQEAFKKALKNVTQGSVVDISSFAKESYSFGKLYNQYEKYVNELKQISNSVTSGGGRAQETEDRVKAVEDSIIDVFHKMQGPSGELAGLIGLSASVKDALEKCKLEALMMTGRSQVDYVLKNDERLLRELSKAEYLSQAGKAVSKADVVVRYDKKGVKIDVGVNIKNYQGYAESTHKKYDGSINLQSDTNMLTLLVRDIGYTGAELANVYNLFGGHPHGPKKNDDLSTKKALAFQEFRKYLAARALMTALTGYKMGTKGISGGESQFFMMHNNLISIQDILVKVLEESRKGVENLSLVSFSPKAEDVLASTEDKNRFVDEGGKLTRKEAAQKRSVSSWSDISSVLKGVKVQVSLTKRVITGLMYG